METKLIVQNTLGEDCEVYQGSHAVISLGNGNCTTCATHRICKNGTVIFKLDDKPNSYRSFKKGQQVPFSYL